MVFLLPHSGCASEGIWLSKPVPGVSQWEEPRHESHLEHFAPCPVRPFEKGKVYSNLNVKQPETPQQAAEVLKRMHRGKARKPFPFLLNSPSPSHTCTKPEAARGKARAFLREVPAYPRAGPRLPAEPLPKQFPE